MSISTQTHEFPTPTEAAHCPELPEPCSQTVCDWKGTTVTQLFKATWCCELLIQALNPVFRRVNLHFLVNSEMALLYLHFSLSIWKVFASSCWERKMELCVHSQLPFTCKAVLLLIIINCYCKADLHQNISISLLKASRPCQQKNSPDNH